MGKRVIIEIKESEKELKRLLSVQKSHKSKLRIRCLLFIKLGKFETQQQLADHVGITRRCLSGWLKVYRSENLEAFLPTGKRNKKSKIISQEMHLGLEEKLKDTSNPLQGYLHAQEWVWEEYKVEVQYHWLRQYLIKHFKTKLKQARKSHINKDEQAEEVFLKTA